MELDPDPIKRITYGAATPMIFDHLQDRNLAAYRNILTRRAAASSRPAEWNLSRGALSVKRGAKGVKRGKAAIVVERWRACACSVTSRTTQYATRTAQYAPRFTN